MKHNTILSNGEIKPGFIPLINRLSTTFYKKNRDFSNSGLSESTKPVIWAHIDSWTESEILHPIIKLFAKEGKYTILMTYSSSLLPVKYDLQRDCDCIDYLFPLPVDNFTNAELFIAFAKPLVVIFAISSYCFNYLYQLKKRNIPTFLIVTKIAKSFPFLKWHDSLYKNALKTFTHIFVFDNESKAFLDKLGVSNVTIDAYLPVAMPGQKIKKDYHDSIIEKFVANEKFIFIGGNIDAEKDLRLVAHLANANPALKCILAPHTISEEHLNRIKYELEGFTLLYSECDENTNFHKVQILVIDFLGDLSHIYSYGSCAYIGGGFTSYLHNVIEATANGLPTSFGPRIKHRALPKYLINLGVSQIVRTPDDIYKWEKNLELNPAIVHKINSDSVQFVERGFETTHRIYTCINSYL